MVQLFCAIVGVAGSVFSVRVDEGDSVGHLKDAIKVKKMYLFPADELRLFLVRTAKKGAKEEEEEKGGSEEEWLTQLDALQGVSDTSDYKHLPIPGAKLRAVGLASDQLGEVSDDEGAAGKSPVHVLVEVPGSCAWKLAKEKCPLLTFEPNNPIIRIPKAYAEGSGLYIGEDGIVLYLRQEARWEWKVLWSSVVLSYAALWIVGPPGTGKSCAAFAFARSLKRVGSDCLSSGHRGGKWNVMWIHYFKLSGSLSCILFSEDDEKRTCTIDRSQLDVVLKSLNDYTVVFLDGYVKERYERDILWRCRQWRGHEEELRRIVVVCAMVSMGKEWRPDLYRNIPSIVLSSLESMVIASAPESNTIQGVIQEEQLFKMCSWTLEDYQVALKNDAFFEHVKKNLTVLNSVETQMELLEEKRFCRWRECADDV